MDAKSVTVRLPRDLARRVKVQAARNDSSIQKIIISALESHVPAVEFVTVKDDGRRDSVKV